MPAAIVMGNITFGSFLKRRANNARPSNTFRKDKFSKIFRKPLGKQASAKAIQGRFKATNPLIKAMSKYKETEKRKREDGKLNGGFAADSENVSSEGSGEDIELSETEDTSIDADNDPTSAPLKSKTKLDQQDVFMNAQEVQAAISELFNKEYDIFELVYNLCDAKGSNTLSTEMFFIKNLLVTPNRFRPEAVTGEGEIAEAAQNTPYKQILTQCQRMAIIRSDMATIDRESDKPPRDFRDLQNAWVQLQDAVNSLMDANRNPVQGAFGRQNDEGIKQRLEKKEGLFRKNMMGKRVNFAARSVISPDPNIETNEIGVPPVFAMKLTYPEPVTDHNFLELKEAVLNGPFKWPGASAIENENGQVINLRTKNIEERQALANQLLARSNVNFNGARNKKVHRHLNNGDIVLMNRQPTLHKPSIMAHRARVLPGEKTIRMHYANCNTYNADFDGDEMNMHFPQNEIARAEALGIADTDHQYLVATSGKPLRGLIQDHISMGVWLTNRDTLFRRDEYYQLLCSCLRVEDGHTTSDRIQTVPPAIIRPSPRWTGKQVITTVLKNITPISHPGLTLEGKSSTSADRWGDESEEGRVQFQDGNLLHGILDKAQIGPTTGGFIHAVYEAYGHTIAGKLLSVLGRLLTKLLHMRAFSCGMDDLGLSEKGNEIRREMLKRTDQIGLKVASNYVTLEDKHDSHNKELLSRLEDVLRDEEKLAGLDSVYNSRTAILTSEITSACLPDGLRKPFPWNQMQTMTTSGAKGSAVNASLISCNLGQQVLEGKRVPVMISGKTLPSFKPFETNIRAGGYISDRFLTGVRPQEYYFHAMAGREGLIDTAIKTARSGYLQRCLIKGMEGLKAEYDSSVRDSDGTMVQFLYGEDGLDVTKQKHLTDFNFLAENYLSLVAQLNVKEEFSKLGDSGAGEWHKVAMRKFRKSGNLDAMDPVLAHFNPGSAMGSTSEKFAAALKAYCDENPKKLLKDKRLAPDAAISKKTFSALLDMKYLRSVIDPGEAVGIVAGQSIGEPSTQMTLNTFHLAGHSAKNVTLGIPRLREIVMTASKSILTPTMSLHLIPELSEEGGQRFAKGLSRLTLAEIIDSVTVSENTGSGIGYESAKQYGIQLNFFPSDEYKDTYAIEIDDVLTTLEYKFIPQLVRAIKKELVAKGDGSQFRSASKPEVGKSSGTIKDAPSRPQEELEGGDDDEDDDGDDDATNNNQKQNRGEAISYAAADDEDEAIAREARRLSSADLESDNEDGPRTPKADKEDDEGDDDQPHPSQLASTLAAERLDRLKSKYTPLTSFTFDSTTGATCILSLEYDISTAKLLLLPLVESVCRSTVIQSIPGLTSAVYSSENSKDPTTGQEVTSGIIHTSGVNLPAMHAYQSLLNPHKLRTNSIHHLLLTYGIEAARALIILELDTVFKGHSISVDNRHLNLIADVMTQAGTYRPFSRVGLREKTSPFGKMSFETTVGFLRDAVLEGDWDDLRGPSARIVMGRVVQGGTGGFGVYMPVG